MTETYNVSQGLKKFAAILGGVGILMVILGGLFGHDGAGRVWSNLLIDSYYFVGIGLGATFFITSHQLGYGGWHVLVKRIPEAMGSIIPVAGAILVFIGIANWAHLHHLYHWNSPEAMHDEILQGKSWYLNAPFHTLRLCLYFAIWWLTWFLFRRISRKEDEIGIGQTYKKSKYIAALFIVVFGVTSSTGSWDIIMSVDPHWYSTLFGWYNLSSYITGSFAVVILITMYLKSQGYLKAVNDEHYHNLAMFMFGFSVFWTYLWFSQFLLIWYGNMSEETIYFIQRIKESSYFEFLFAANLIMNFFLPFLILMKRKSKRNLEVLGFSSVLIFLGHWIDIYMMVTPGTVGAENATLGLVEFGMLFAFIALFIFVVFNALTKAPLIPVNNPYLRESIQHHTLKS